MKKLLTPLLLSAVISASSPSFANNASFELGLGIPYGVLGGNANFDIGNNVELFAGLGMVVGMAEVNGDDEFAADLGYSLGARYYVAPYIRLLAGYGTIGGILTKENEWSDDIDMETVKGRYIGVGYISSRNKGLVADLLYVDTENFDDKINELEQTSYLVDVQNSKVKFSVGYRF